jgi:hypothetical protein
VKTPSQTLLAAAGLPDCEACSISEEMRALEKMAVAAVLSARARDTREDLGGNGMAPR